MTDDLHDVHGTVAVLRDFAREHGVELPSGADKRQVVRSRRPVWSRPRPPSSSEIAPGCRRSAGSLVWSRPWARTARTLEDSRLAPDLAMLGEDHPLTRQIRRHMERVRQLLG
jgi:hypothetical protein